MYNVRLYIIGNNLSVSQCLTLGKK